MLLRSLVIMLLLCSPLLAESNRRKSIKPIRIMEIKVYDQGVVGKHSLEIDVIQGACPVEEGKFEPEPFFDTLAGITVRNITNVPIRLKKVRFIIPKDKAVENSVRLKSKRYSLSSVGEVSPGEDKEVIALALSQIEGAKYLYPQRGPITEDFGIRNIKFVLFGVDFNNRRVKVRSKLGVAFRNANRC